MRETRRRVGECADRGERAHTVERFHQYEETGDEGEDVPGHVADDGEKRGGSGARGDEDGEDGGGAGGRAKSETERGGGDENGSGGGDAPGGAAAGIGKSGGRAGIGGGEIAGELLAGAPSENEEGGAAIREQGGQGVEPQPRDESGKVLAIDDEVGRIGDGQDEAGGIGDEGAGEQIRERCGARFLYRGVDGGCEDDGGGVVR